jgi:hypothetical protein
VYSHDASLFPRANTGKKHDTQKRGSEAMDQDGDQGFSDTVDQFITRYCRCDSRLNISDSALSGGRRGDTRGSANPIAVLTLWVTHTCITTIDSSAVIASTGEKTMLHLPTGGFYLQKMPRNRDTIAFTSWLLRTHKMTRPTRLPAKYARRKKCSAF